MDGKRMSVTHALITLFVAVIILWCVLSNEPW